MDDAMVNPRSEMERIPNARMESSPTSSAVARTSRDFPSRHRCNPERIALQKLRQRAESASAARALAFSDLPPPRPQRARSRLADMSVFGRPLRPFAELLGLSTG